MRLARKKNVQCEMDNAQHNFLKARGKKHQNAGGKEPMTYTLALRIMICDFKEGNPDKIQSSCWHTGTIEENSGGEGEEKGRELEDGFPPKI